MFIKYFIIHSHRICSLLILCWRQESSLTMCQFLFKISYHSTIFNFSFRNGDKVMSALRVWQHMRERKMVTLHSWLFYSNTHLLFLITIKKILPFFSAIFPGHVHFNLCNGYAVCKSNLGWMAVREPRRNPLLALSCIELGSAQHMAPDLFLYLASWSLKAKNVYKCIGFATFQALKQLLITFFFFFC